MRTILFISLITLLTSCKTEKMKCSFNSPNEELVIYKSAIVELIENSMHLRYLGGKEEAIKDEYLDFEKGIDTATLNNEIAKVHNEIYNNPAKFCTLYLDTTRKENISYGTIPDKRTKALIREYTKDEKSAAYKLNNFPKYELSDLELCTARLEYYNDSIHDNLPCSLGRLRLSMPILNDSKNRGLMKYDWRCGGLCGHGGFIQIVKEIDSWKIEVRMGRVY